MAELTTLDEKLGEVMGLAQAAQEATTKVERLIENRNVAKVLQRMRKEAEETERRCAAVAGARDGKKTAITAKARATKSEARQMMSTYLGRGSDGLDGLEFLVMAEAGEVGHWSVLGTLNETAGDRAIRDLVRWALPIQERHLKDARQASLAVAARMDPNEPA